MIFTEEDATYKRCCGPEGCGATTELPIGNIYVSGRYCIASQCMAWRFVIEREPLTPEEFIAAGRAIGVAAALKPMIKPRRGYCGLAGHENAKVGAGE